jgi:hypothetical protein
VADIDQALSDAATAPKRASSGDRSAEGQPIPDLIALDKYVTGKAAVARAGGAWGLVGGARVVPPGTVGPSEQAT